MKTMIAIAAVALILGGVHLQHSTATAPVRGTWTGEISSNHCGTMHKHGMTERDCTRQCVEHGAEYVLLSERAVYRFANQADPQLNTHAGATVVVSGEVSGITLAAFTIEGRP